MASEEQISGAARSACTDIAPLACTRRKSASWKPCQRCGAALRPDCRTGAEHYLSRICSKAYISKGRINVSRYALALDRMTVRKKLAGRRKSRPASLTNLRRVLGLSQKAVARALQASQPEVSRIERRADLHVSTLRRYIEALGGELELTARFPRGVVPIASPSAPVTEGLVDSCPLCTRHVVGVRHQSGPFPSLWAQPKTRLQRRFPSGESRD